MSRPGETTRPLDWPGFRRALVSSGLVDDGYPLASLVWRPRGVQMLHAFAEQARRMLRSLGYEEHVMPSIAAREEFDRINTHIHDFSKGVLQPSDTMVLRPSGESVFYPMFRRWIRTSADLPLRAFEVGRSIRAGRPQGLFRQTESALFIEAHSAHATQEDAHIQCQANVELLGRFLSSCAVPAFHVIRPQHTNKPVAQVHHGFDVMLPFGQSLLVGSAYEQGQLFSRAFDVRFTDRQGVAHHTWQVELGFSHRVLLASLWLTSDEHGLCMLPALAPHETVVVQIGDESAVKQAAEGLAAGLRAAGGRIHHRAISQDELGRTRRDVEQMGTPLRIEVGRREVDAGELSIRARDGHDHRCTFADAARLQKDLLARFEHSVLARAAARCEERFAGRVESGDMSSALRQGRCASTALCAQSSCVDALERSIGVGEVLGHRRSHHAAACAVCAAPTELEAVAARRV